MWPTFYLPRLSVIPDSDSHLCGTATGSAGVPIVVPNPPIFQSGQNQVVIVSYKTNSTITWPASGWNQIFEAADIAGSGSYQTSTQKVYWRQWNGSDPPFSATVPSGFEDIAYLSVAIGNQNVSDPIFTGYMQNPDATVPYTRCPIGPAQYLEFVSAKDLFLQWSTNAYGFNPADEPNPADVSFACTNNDNFSPPGIGHTLAAVRTANDANNLIPYSDLSLSGWTAFGITRDVFGVNSSTLSKCRLRATAASSKHYMSTTVNLTAGKTYAFVMSYSAFNNAGLNIWMTYIKPDASEHGFGCDASQSVRKNLVGSTEVLWTGDNILNANPIGDINYGIFGSVLGFLIHADQTGTYELRIHLSDGSDPNTPNAPNTTYAAYLESAAVVDGPTKMQVPVLLPTSGAAIAKGSVPYFLPRPPVVPNAIASWPWSAFVMRKAGGKRPLCKLMNAQQREVLVHFSDNAITESRLAHPMDNGDLGFFGARTSHSVYSFLSQKKFYTELHLSSYGTGIADDSYSIGVCPMECMITRSGILSIPGSLVGQYSYSSTGKTFTNGVQDAGLIAAWAPGDDIGVGIDFNANQVTFYRNGSLVKTQSLNAAQVTRMFVGMFGYWSFYSADKQAQISYNFRGSFSGRKPAGFSAFDFDNEIP